MISRRSLFAGALAALALRPLGVFALEPVDAVPAPDPLTAQDVIMRRARQRLCCLDSEAQFTWHREHFTYAGIPIVACDCAPPGHFVAIDMSEFNAG